MNLFVYSNASILFQIKNIEKEKIEIKNSNMNFKIKLQKNIMDIRVVV